MTIKARDVIPYVAHVRRSLFRARGRGFAERFPAADVECENLLYDLESRSSEDVQVGGGERARLAALQNELHRYLQEV
jgi:hypothetical protein